jgi:hypothetical protein
VRPWRSWVRRGVRVRPGRSRGSCRCWLGGCAWDGEAGQMCGFTAVGVLIDRPFHYPAIVTSDQLRLGQEGPHGNEPRQLTV